MPKIQFFVQYMLTTITRVLGFKYHLSIKIRWILHPPILVERSDSRGTLGWNARNKIIHTFTQSEKKYIWYVLWRKQKKTEQKWWGSWLLRETFGALLKDNLFCLVFSPNICKVYPKNNTGGSSCCPAQKAKHCIIFQTVITYNQYELHVTWNLPSKSDNSLIMLLSHDPIFT